MELHTIEAVTRATNWLYANPNSCERQQKLYPVMIIGVSTRCSELLNSFHIGYNGMVASDKMHYI